MSDITIEEAAPPLTEEESPALPEDEALTEEEEEAAYEAESHRRMSRLARGCMGMAVVFLVLAGGFLLLESKAHLSVLYLLPPHTLSLTCVAASFFSMMAALFSLRKTTFAMLVMILGGWMVLGVMAVIYVQQPETITRTLPGTDQSVRLTLVSTPISSTLYIEEPLTENLLAKRWKFQVHGKNIPLDELIALEETDADMVALYFEDTLWAVCDPAAGKWMDTLTYEEEYLVDE